MDSSNEGHKTWFSSFKDNAFYFIVTVLIIIGTGYFNFRMRMTSFQQKAQSNQSKLENVNEEIEEMQMRRERLRLQMTRINTKINALLRSQGLKPSNFDNRLEYNEPDKKQ